MKASQAMSVLYEIALVIGGETDLQPLLTKTLQKLLFHTAMPVGLFLHFDSDQATERLDVRLDAAVGNHHLKAMQDHVISLPASLVAGEGGLLTDQELLSNFSIEGVNYRFGMKLPVPGEGVILLLSHHEPVMELPIAEVLKPVLNNLSRVMKMCRSHMHLTERMAADRDQARAELSRFRAALDTSDDGFFIIDPEAMRFVDFNRAAVSRMGYDADELLAMGPQDIKSNVNEADLRRRFREILDSPRRTGELTTVHRCKNGEEFPVEVRLSALRQDDGKDYLIAVARDISERMRAEAELRQHRNHLESLVAERTRELAQARDEALAATKAKSTFLANMSHELRTPLNSIIGFTSILRDQLSGPVNSEQRNQLNMVYNSSRHLLDLINDILDLSKVEAGKMTFNKENISVTRLVADLAEVIRPQAEAKGLGFNVMELSSSFSLFTDEHRLRQIMLNLIGNAIKFTAKGNVTLTVEMVDRMAVFNVIDTGIGIAEEETERIFKAFQQLDDGTERQFEGTGLGLAISRQLAELLGGAISVQSEPGMGSTFTLQIPLARALTGTTQLREKMPRGGASQRVVLVVDDEEGARELLRNHLEREGYRVVFAEDGHSARIMAREYNPEVITLDILMPDQSGWEVLAQLKQDPLTAHIPVIEVSVLEENNIGLSLGAVDYLVKPVEGGRLRRALQRAVTSATDILVIEDHESDAELLRALLEPEGFNVYHASDGMSGLQMVEQLKPALVLVDLMLPGMSGFEVIERLRENPNLAGVPIVVISAKELTAEESAFLNGTVERVIAKAQFSRDSFLAEVNACLAEEARV